MVETIRVPIWRDYKALGQNPPALTQSF